MNEPLYGFQLNDDGSITRYEHYDYEVIENQRSGTLMYRFTHKGRRILKTECQLDRFLNGYVYTFDPDMERVGRIIRSILEDKLTKARTETEVIRLMLDMMERQAR